MLHTGKRAGSFVLMVCLILGMLAGLPMTAMAEDPPPLTAGDIAFGTLSLGYTPPDAQPIVITNNGVGNSLFLANITVLPAGLFNIIPGDNGILPDNGGIKDDWKIQPVAGLAADTYTAAITIEANATGALTDPVTATATATVTFTVSAPPVDAVQITNTATAMDVVAGDTGSLAVTTSGGEAAITFSATSEDGSPLPGWIAIDPATGVITAVPPAEQPQGNTVIVVSATDGVTSFTKHFTVRVVPPPEMSLTAENADVPELINGRYPAAPNDAEGRALTVTLEEVTLGSWKVSEQAVFTFSENVKPRAVDIKTTNMDGPAEFTLENAENGTSSANGWTLDDSGLTSTGVAVTAGERAKVELTFYLSIRPGFKGDIELTAGGAALPEALSVLIARALNPFVVQAESTAILVGSDYGQYYPVKDIFITETRAGTLKKDDTLSVAVEGMKIESGRGSVEVTAGYMKISTAVKAGAMHLTVGHRETAPCTIRIYEHRVGRDRTVPGGQHSLLVGGSAAANYCGDSAPQYGTFDTEYYAVVPGYVDVEITPSCQIRVSANPSLGGVVSGEGSYQKGSSHTVTAVPNENYTFKNWTVDGVEVGASPSYTFTVAASMNLVANFTYTGDPEEEETYTYRTLTDPATGVSVTGLFADGATLAVAENELQHSVGDCPVCDEIQMHIAVGSLLILYDISITGGYRDDPEVTIPVGSEYDGQRAFIIHCANKTREEKSFTVKDGKITGTFTGFSPFAVLRPEVSPSESHTSAADTGGMSADTAVGAGVPKTGDSAMTPLWRLWALVSISGLAICAGVLIWLRRRSKG